ncbi:metallophosphoesterase [Nitrospina watsonii]|uniref:Metallophos domain-containing protein n=1 Tax=Nitrospina watsonii TaxID=1323948 RepID=A0ABM9H9X6_9BACT|nr:metallophosphoesterase [Nitrospina watsonii]CAI2716954.1 Metallophos domain-containing protein [Nitrospina watsonii]
MLRRFLPHRNPFPLLLITLALCLAFAPPAWAHGKAHLKVVVVGDTGIGERAHTPGFDAVQQSMRQQGADILLHLGDFVYQDQMFPAHCPDRYLHTLRQTLVTPYPVRLFVAGDNDLPPVKWKPKASGCWDRIAKLATPFDTFPGSPAPRVREGVMQFDLVLFVVLDALDWKDPTPWLKPLIEEARAKQKWVIVALHEPALTTAWYLDKRQTVLKQINALAPDLVFAGNQHSYERFYPLGVPDANGGVPFIETSDYARGQGVTHIVTGGGGATFKPFADQEGNAEHTAPPAIRKALATRALMFHYLTLEMDHDRLQLTTFRVCAPASADHNPRWRSKMKAWERIRLECDGQAVGVTPYDTVTIRNP